MDYNNSLVTVGKVRTYDSLTGEIISKDGVYIFTKENISDGEKINENDTVLFRGEEINNIKVAFFIKKLNPELGLEEEIYRKVKRKEKVQEND